MSVTPPKALTRAEYLVSGHLDSQTVGARRELIAAAQRVLPAVFETLKESVYPAYVRLADSSSEYWRPGWRFRTWRQFSDRQNQLTPLLLKWVRRFHAEEEWILEGALQTLYFWHRYPKDLESLDVRGFYAAAAGPVVITDDEKRFEFEDWGWDPLSVRWSAYKSHVRRQFERALRDYEMRLRRLAESRGAVRARYRFSARDFEWFVWYQLGGLSSRRILERTQSRGDESTILKGIKVVSALLHWQHPRKARMRKGTT